MTAQPPSVKTPHMRVAVNEVEVDLSDLQTEEDERVSVSPETVVEPTKTEQPE